MVESIIGPLTAHYQNDALRRARGMMVATFVVSVIGVTVVIVSVLGFFSQFGIALPLVLTRVGIGVVGFIAALAALYNGRLNLASGMHAGALLLTTVLVTVVGAVPVGSGALVFLVLSGLYLTPRGLLVLTGSYAAMFLADAFMTMGSVELLGAALLQMTSVMLVGSTMALVSRQISASAASATQRSNALETVFDISLLINSLLVLDEMLPEVLGRVRREYDLDRMRVYLLDPERGMVNLRAAVDSRETPFQPDAEWLPVAETTLVGQAINTREVTRGTTAVGDRRYRVEAAIPLMVGREVVGVLDVSAERRHDFSATELYMLRTLSSQLAIAIQNARAVGSEASLLEATSPIYRATQQIAMAVDAESILQTLRRMVAPDADRISLVSVQFGQVGEPVTEVLATWDRDGLELDSDFPEEVRLHVGSRTMVVRDSNDLTEEDSVLRAYARHVLRSRSFLIVPLVVRDRTVGYMIYAYYEPRDYSEHEVRTIQALAGQTGVVLDNLTLLNVLSSQTDQLAEVNDFARAAIATRTLEELGRVVVNSVSSYATPAYISYAALEPPSTVHIYTLMEGRQDVDDLLARGGGGLPSRRFPLQETSLQQALEGPQPDHLHTLSTTDYMHWLPEYIRSVVVLPLTGDDGQVTGSLNVGFNVDRDLEAHIITLFEQIANVFSGVLQKNAYLQRALDQLRESTDLYSTVLALNAAETLPELFETTLKEIAHLTGAERVVFYQAGPDPIEGEDVEFLAEVATYEHGQIAMASRPPRYQLESAPVLAQFPLTRANLVFNSAPSDKRLSESIRDSLSVSGVNAVLAVPVATGEFWLGAIVAEKFGQGTFTRKNTRQARSLVDQAALALKALTLLERNRSAVARERAMREVIARIRAAQDREAVMAVAADEVAGVLGITEEEARLITDRTTQRRGLEGADRDLIESISTQVDLALQNISLLESAEQTAFREQLINEITAEIQRVLTVDDVMKRAAQMLGSSFGGHDVTLRLSTRSRTLPDGVVMDGATHVTSREGDER